MGLAPSPSAPAREPVLAYVGLGANLGDAGAALHTALGRLTQAPGVLVCRSSGWYRSAPVDATGPDYLNAVAELCTTLTAMDVLALLQALENQAGRERPYRNAPRTLDLDLLIYGDARIQAPTLEVPHPRMWCRAFVLLPLAELAPERVSAEVLASVQDQAIARLPTQVLT
ncbi:FolK 7,8-dihydro-6-hydroxymethylpterin-pyrophosphokinase [Burkholderiaceae bacterium]